MPLLTSPQLSPAQHSASFSLPIGAAVVLLLVALALAALLGALLAVRLYAAWLRSPARLAAMLGALPCPAVLVSQDGRLLSANAEAASWVEHHSPPALLPPLAAFARQVAASHRGETAMIALDVGQPPLEVQGSPLSAHLGRTVLLAALTARTEGQVQLTRLIAHEVGTPLTAIVGHAEILESCEPTDEALRQRSARFIAAETQRLASLVNDWLALSRLEAAPLMRTINLRVVIEHALSSLYERAESDGLTLTLESPNSLPRVRGDAQRMEQVAYNLLDNAIKYTPSGGAVSVHLVPEEESVRVEVRDSGMGIPAEDLPHICEPLYRSESVRHLPGTGLGLTLVHAILEQHGTSLDVRSQFGQGTTFAFSLRIARS